jgi:hypothetical protein
MTRRRLQVDAAIVPLAIATAALWTLLPIAPGLRLPATLVLTLLAPGLALEAALDSPMSRDPLVRWVKVVAGSVAVSVLAGLLVDVLPGIDLTRTSRALSIGELCLALCAVGAGRGAAALPLMPRPARGWLKAAPALIAAAGFVVIAGAIAVRAAHRQDQATSVLSLWLVPRGAGGCTVGVTQRHAAPGRLRLVLRATGNPTRTKDLRSSGHLDARVVLFASREAATGQITAELFGDGNAQLLRRATIGSSECGPS